MKTSLLDPQTWRDAGQIGKKKVARPIVKTAMTPIVHIGATRSKKTYSAMIRVRNEEEYLEPSILSIIDVVDEVIVVDNNSTDRTPQIIGQLVSQFPGKIRTYTYPYDIARAGQENIALATSPGGLRSPRLLANYYNFCLARCTMSFVLKWDADTIATDSLASALADFGNSPAQVLHHTGANLHESRDHLIGGHPFEDMEPRLYARRFASYNNGMYSCEMLRSPYVEWFPRFSLRWPTPLYVHMKYCKASRFTNISDDLRQTAAAITTLGPPVSDEVAATVKRWGLGLTGSA